MGERKWLAEEIRIGTNGCASISEFLRYCAALLVVCYEMKRVRESSQPKSVIWTVSAGGLLLSRALLRVVPSVWQVSSSRWKHVFLLGNH